MILSNFRKKKMTISELEKGVFYKALLAKDSEYDGVFFVGVKTTGVFCQEKPRLFNRSERSFSFKTASSNDGNTEPHPSFDNNPDDRAPQATIQ